MLTIWASVQATVGAFFSPEVPENYGAHLLEMATMLLFFVLLYKGRKVLPAPYLAYLVIGLLLPLFITHGNPDKVLAGLLRYVSGLFPGFIVLAILAEDWRVDLLVLVGFLMPTGLLTALFVGGRYVAGVG